MILHVIFDDIFGDQVCKQFLCYEKCCRIVLLSSSNLTIKYVTRIKPEDVIFCDTNAYLNLIEHLDMYSSVVMHGLFSVFQYEIIRRLPKHVKLAWVEWGAEIYSRKDVFVKNLSTITGTVYRAHVMWDCIRGRKNQQNDVPLDVLRRVDYLLESSREVYEFTKKYIGNDNLKHLQYSYYNLIDIIGDSLYDKMVDGSNILIGNSASVEGNHIDAMFHLWKNKFTRNSAIYMPLSYGELWIKNLFNKVGYLFFPNSFIPLLNFLPRGEYNKILCSCSVVVMNHYRPNALGNILTALWLGSRVYVSNYNPQTQFFKRIGLNVFSIEDDLDNLNDTLLMPLSTTEILRNRDIIKRIYGADVIKNNIENIINVLQ